MDQRITVKFYLIRCKLPDLAGKRLERHLEELVDGAHIEGTVVVEDIDKDLFSTGFQSFRIRTKGRDEIVEIRRLLRIRCECAELEEDA